MGGLGPNHSTIPATKTSLKRLVTTLLRSSLAESTQQAYKGAFKLFCSFHIKYYGSQPQGKISQSKLIAFIAYCHFSGLSYKSICSRVSALNFINRFLGARKSCHTFMVKRILLGCKRLSPSSDKRRPITIKILKRLCNVVVRLFTNKYNRRLIKAMFCLSFFALLRIGEITTSKTANHTLQYSSVTVSKKKGYPKKLSVTLKHYKHSVSPFTIILKPFSIKEVCPVQAVSDYMAIRSSITGPLFINEKGTPITNKQFTKTLRRCISKLGLDPSLYTSHSFRIGGATFAHSQNLSDSQIRQLGRWNSDAFKSYLRPCSLLN